MSTQQRTRICIVNPFQYGGGAEVQIDYLIDCLRKSDRWEIFYLTHHVEPSLANGRYHVVKVGNGDKVPRFGYTTDLVSLYRELRRIKPAVIYQRVAGPYTAACAFYARKHNVSLIWHVAHDTDVSKGSIGSGKNFVRHFLDKRLAEYGLHRASAIVVQKHEQARLLQQNYARSAALEVPNFHPEPLERIDKSGELTVLWVSNFKEWKQPEVFVRLASQLRDLSGVRFVMVGHLDASCGGRQWYDSLTRDMESALNLFYLGAKPLAEVNELLARAHVFVNTSKSEGFPNTFIQAWLRHVPVVSLHVDPDDVLERAKLGIHARSEANLISAVRILIEDASLRETLGRNAYDYSREVHSINNATRLIRLFEGNVAEIGAVNAQRALV